MIKNPVKLIVNLFLLGYFFGLLSKLFIAFETISIIIYIINTLVLVLFTFKKKNQLLIFILFLSIFIIFQNELTTFKWNNSVHLGIVLSFVATFWASTGNMIHQRNFNYKIPFFPSLAYGMLYGSLFTLVVSKIRGAELIFDYSTTYIFSLLYLILFGSVFGFYLYLSLLERIGSARAGYIGVIMPIAALTISTIFEGLEWKQNLVFGLPILILGCILILNQKSKGYVKK